VTKDALSCAWWRLLEVRLVCLRLADPARRCGGQDRRSSGSLVRSKASGGGKPPWPLRWFVWWGCWLLAVGCWLPKNRQAGVLIQEGCQAAAHPNPDRRPASRWRKLCVRSDEAGRSCRQVHRGGTHNRHLEGRGGGPLCNCVVRCAVERSCDAVQFVVRVCYRLITLGIFRSCTGSCIHYDKKCTNSDTNPNSSATMWMDTERQHRRTWKTFLDCTDRTGDVHHGTTAPGKTQHKSVRQASRPWPPPTKPQPQQQQQQQQR